MAEVLLKFYVKGRHNLPRIINFFQNLCQYTKIYVTNFVSSWFWWIADWGFNGMNTSLSKFWSRSILMLIILWLIKLELYCFGIRIPKIVVHCLYSCRTSYIQCNKLSIKKLTKDNWVINKWRILAS